MAGVIKRTEFTFETEILRSASGLDDVKSSVIAATKCNTTFSGIAGRIIIPAGCVMVKIAGDAKKRVAPLYMNDGTAGQGALVGTGAASAYQAADVAGILSRTLELIVGDGAVTDVSDTDVSLFYNGNHFNIAKLYGYKNGVDAGTHGGDNSAIVKQALYNCLFS
jgi:hypothetical protein